MWKEFKKFALRGNMLDLAVGVIIGGAFNSLVSTLVDNVIMPILSGPRMLMNRNLLYTGVTRAKRCVTIVGNENTVQDMVRNKSENRRYTDLELRIEEFNTILE